MKPISAATAKLVCRKIDLSPRFVSFGRGRSLYVLNSQPEAPIISRLRCMSLTAVVAVKACSPWRAANAIPRIAHLSQSMMHVYTTMMNCSWALCRSEAARALLAAPRPACCCFAASFVIRHSSFTAHSAHSRTSSVEHLRSRVDGKAARECNSARPGASTGQCE